MKKLADLIAAVIADGVVDANEVTEIKEVVYADGVIDTEEVRGLFQINDAVSGNENAPEWQALFVEAVQGNILADGTIDDEETALLVELIGADGQVDAVENALLLSLKEATGELPEALENMVVAYAADNEAATA